MLPRLLRLAPPLVRVVSTRAGGARGEIGEGRRSEVEETARLHERVAKRSAEYSWRFSAQQGDEREGELRFQEFPAHFLLPLSSLPSTSLTLSGPSRRLDSTLRTQSSSTAFAGSFPDLSSSVTFLNRSTPLRLKSGAYDSVHRVQLC